MLERFATDDTSLGDVFVQTWAAQGRDGFLLCDPASAGIEIREAFDDHCGVTFRFRWMPHREIRGDVAELERRGILNPQRDRRKLLVDERDPQGRHCFLCESNIRECQPAEILLPVSLAGGHYYAGANFAWIEPDHFTVMTARHTDQRYTRHALEAMIELHTRTGGRFRVLFNGPGAGATITWHFHFQITSAALPVESMNAADEARYPTPVRSFLVGDDGLNRAHDAVEAWLDGDAQDRSLNLLIAPSGSGTRIFFFPRDQRYARADGKGLVGGFEVAGDFVFSAPAERHTFDHSSVSSARHILEQIHPPDWETLAA